MKNNNVLLEELTDQLKAAFDTRLKSIVMFGSCAIGECNTLLSGVNLIVIIDSLCANDLKTANSFIKDWQKSKNPMPIFMDKDEWFNSTDVYPIEYTDIKERHKIVYGEDVVTPLQIDSNNLRLQCELEIKNLLIKLRQTYLGLAKDKKVLEQLILLVSKSLTAIFRAILRYKQISGAKTHEQVIEKISELINIDKEFFLKIVELKKNKKRIDKNEIDTTIQKLIDSINIILKYVDKLDKGEN